MLNVAGWLAAVAVAVVLMVAALAKLIEAQALEDVGSGMFATRLGSRSARAATRFIAAFELVLATGICITTRSSIGLVTLGFWCCAALFSTYLRRINPAAGCGCFGAETAIDVSMRRARSRHLALILALSALTLLAMTRTSHGTPRWLPLGVAVVLAISTMLFRRRIPALPRDCVYESVDRKSALRRMSRHQERRQLDKSGLVYSLADDWREGCWWFFVFHESTTGRELIFAQALHRDRNELRVGVVEPEPDLLEA